MRKGKFGFAVWLYPYIALWTLFLGMDIMPFLITGLVLVTEKDEWATKQCLHTVIIGIFYKLYQWIMAFLVTLPLAGYGFIIVDFVIDLVFFILLFIIGFFRLKRGKSILMFGMGIINQAYGYIKPKVNYPPQGYQYPPYPVPPAYAQNNPAQYNPFPPSPEQAPLNYQAPPANYTMPPNQVPSNQASAVPPNYAAPAANNTPPSSPYAAPPAAETQTSYPNSDFMPPPPPPKNPQ